MTSSPGLYGVVTTTEDPSEDFGPADNVEIIVPPAVAFALICLGKLW